MASAEEDFVVLESPTDAEDVAADYRYAGLTLWHYPMSFLRERTAKSRFIPSDVLQDSRMANSYAVAESSPSGSAYLSLSPCCVLRTPTL